MCNDYREYDGDTVHDMWVDYTAEQYEDGSNSYVCGRSAYTKPKNRRHQQQLTEKRQNKRNLQARDIKRGTLAIAVACIILVIIVALI